MSETTPDPADVHTGTDRVELTEDEFDSTTGHHFDCWVNEGLGTCDKDCTRLLHARCAELEQRTEAERDALQTLTTEVGRLQSLVDIDHVGHSRVMEAERDAARAELAAANTRCAELEAERDVLRGPWRDSLEAWNTYNEGFGYSGDFDRPIMAAFRTGFDTGRAERDALQATLDRVTALADEWTTPIANWLRSAYNVQDDSPTAEDVSNERLAAAQRMTKMRDDLREVCTTREGKP